MSDQPGISESGFFLEEYIDCSSDGKFSISLHTSCITSCNSTGVHSLQLATEAGPTLTIPSVDGIGAYDHVSRTAMLTALRNASEANQTLPFSRMFYSTPSTYLRVDHSGEPLDPLGDHGAACPGSGALRPRAVGMERAAARICREAGATVSTNVLVRGLNEHTFDPT